MSFGGGGLGSGGFFGSQGGPAGLGPRGPYGIWPGCGCSSVVIMIALILLACGGCMRMFGQ